jgi:hypothetical protein
MKEIIKIKRAIVIQAKIVYLPKIKEKRLLFFWLIEEIKIYLKINMYILF